MNTIPTKRRFPSTTYRRIRRGLITLPELENRLVFDLRRITTRVSKDGPSDLTEIYVREAITAVDDAVTELEQSFEELRAFLGPHILNDIEDLKRTIDVYVPELPPDMKEEFMLVIRGYGSAGELINTVVERLRAKHGIMQAALEMVHGGSAEELASAVGTIEAELDRSREEGYPTYLDSPRAQLFEKCKKALEEAKNKIATATTYWDREHAKQEYFDVLEMICQLEAPDLQPGWPPDLGQPGWVAQELGLTEECKHLARHEFFCMLLCGPAFCLVIMILVIACSRDCAG